MNNPIRLTERAGLVLCTALLGVLAGCTTYVEQPRPREVYAPRPPEYVPPPVVYSRPAPVYAPTPSVQIDASFGSVGVEIRSEDDFYEPLDPYGRWEVVGSYGRCWIPDRVDREWRPYCNGYWQRTEAGWYWASDEPWGWATYHYGRWDFNARFGWYWVPQTQWAPAWVSWHEGGGYVGWAPLHPSARVSVGGSISIDIALISPRAFVFVEPRRFLQPVRPTTVVVNNTTIINKTVNITNVKVVNNTVINEGPRTQVIEQASGQKVQAVPVRELRRKQEAEVVARQRTTPSGRAKKEKNEPASIRNEPAPRDATPSVDAPRRAKDADVVVQEQAQRAAREQENRNQAESQRRANEAAAKAQEEAQRSARESERITRTEAQRAKEGEQNAPGNSAVREKRDQIALEKGGSNVIKKANKKKGKGKPVRPEKPDQPVPEKNN